MSQSRRLIFIKWRKRIREIIFLSDTKAGKVFDIILIVLIIFSVLTVMLESVAVVRAYFLTYLVKIEWIVTIIFLLEYIVRVCCASRPS